MYNDDSILDRVIETQKKQEIEGFDPVEVLKKLLQTLPDRDQDIVKKRHGLLDESVHTLEEIGKLYGITRERVRQIEVSSVKLLKEKLKNEEEYQHALAVVEDLIAESGGVIEEETLLEKMRQKIAGSISDNIITFFLNYLLKDSFSIIKGRSDLYTGWQLPNFDTSLLRKTIEVAVELMQKIDKVITFDEFFKVFKETDFYKLNTDVLSSESFASFLSLSKKIKQNPFSDWGLRQWKLITPKRMNDKIYLVLLHHGKPLHFRDIAKKINEVKFDGKQAHPATVHNELILDNKRYVLVGRGIYGLKEWGYKPGVVADVIEHLLSDHEELTKDEIIQKVLEQRMVKKTTIVLALMNKDKFTKTAEGKYRLAVKTE